MPNIDRRGEIAELLRKRLEELRERDAGLARPGWTWQRPSSPPHGEPVDLASITRQVLARYKGRSLLEAIGGEEVPLCRNLLVAREEALMQPLPDREVEREVEAALWLVPGIRDGVAARLFSQGYTDLRTLSAHPRFGARARRILRALEKRDASFLMENISERAGRGHPLNLALHALVGPLLFLDIETMGLFGGSPVVVAGLALMQHDRLLITQYVAASPEAESGLISMVARALEQCPGIVTFNGRTFDYPYLCQRSAYYGRPIVRDPVHIDLLPISRRVFRGQVPDCRLATLARLVLGEERDEDIPGSLVPMFYQEYLEDPERKMGLLAAIVEHNRADVVQTARLFGHLAASATGRAAQA